MTLNTTPLHDRVLVRRLEEKEIFPLASCTLCSGNSTPPSKGGVAAVGVSANVGSGFKVVAWSGILATDLLVPNQHGAKHDVRQREKAPHVPS